MFKTSFNGLEISVHGVYAAYNLSSGELSSLKRKFEDKVNGSNGNYVAYKNVERKVLLKLFVHEVWLPITFDIRDELLKLYGSSRIYKKDIEYLSKKLKDMRLQLHVDYSFETKKWVIVDYDGFVSLLAKLISEQKNNAG